MFFQFPKCMKVKGWQIGTAWLLIVLKRLSQCNHLHTASTISQQLDMTLQVLHVLSIFHNESLFSWSILPKKMNCSACFYDGVNFQLTHHFLLILGADSCHYPNKIPATGSCGTELLSAQALISFRNIAICVRTSITYFLTAHCRWYHDFYIYKKKALILTQRKFWNKFFLNITVLKQWNGQWLILFMHLLKQQVLKLREYLI